jgi:hypothetical protein
VGVCAGVVYVLLLEQMLRPVRSVTDLSESLTAPVLGVLPIRQPKQRKSWLLLALHALLGEPAPSKEFSR